MPNVQKQLSSDKTVIVFSMGYGTFRPSVGLAILSNQSLMINIDKDNYDEVLPLLQEALFIAGFREETIRNILNSFVLKTISEERSYPEYSMYQSHFALSENDPISF